MYKSTVWDIEESDSTKVITWWFTVFESRNVVFGIPLTKHGSPGFLLCSPTEFCWTALKFTSVRDLGFLEPWIQSKTCKERKRSPPVCKNDSERTNEHTKEFQNCRIHTIKANLLFLFLSLLDRNTKWRWTTFWIMPVSEGLRAHRLLWKICQIFYFFLRL